MIYLDNSATTYPKPPEVLRAVQNAVRNYGFNPGRGGYRQSMMAAERVYEARKTATDFFHLSSAENVIFTVGCTHALNTVIKGVLNRGDHVVISSLEHNAVVRPLHKLQEQGIITYSVAEVNVADDEATVNAFRDAINERTKLFICTHASNVFGFRLPVERLCALAHSYRILFCLDAAQSAGVVPIDMTEDGYDFVCCAGHKYLYGPMGIGLLLIGNDNVVDSFIEGGTGSLSSEYAMPDFYPDKLEAGTQNLIGILGLQAGIRFVKSHGTDNIYRREMRLINSLYDSLKNSNNLQIYGPHDKKAFSAPVLSFTVTDVDSESVAKYLSEHYNIAVRGGLHCAPLAHQSMGTAAAGTVRVAPSVFTTYDEMQRLLISLRKFL